MFNAQPTISSVVRFSWNARFACFGVMYPIGARIAGKRHGFERTREGLSYQLSCQPLGDDCIAARPFQRFSFDFVH